MVQKRIEEMESAIATSTMSGLGREKKKLDLDGLKQARDELFSSVGEAEDLLERIEAS